MATTNSFSVIFFLRKKVTKSGKLPVYCRITVQGKSVELSTKIEIDELKWDKARGLGLSKTDEGRKTNLLLESIKGKILTDYNHCLFNNEFVNPEILKNRFLGIVDQNKRMTVLELFDYHNQEMKNMLEWGTLKNYFTSKKYFELYIKTVVKRKDVELHELKYSFLSGFEVFMRNHQTSIDPERPCNNNTIMKHIERFRKVVNLAIKNEWMDKDPFVKFRPKFIHKDRDFLTPQELQKIEKKNFSIKRLQEVKDLFIFSCYTGLAYIDVFNLETSNVTLGINGKLWITTVAFPIIQTEYN